MSGEELEQVRERERKREKEREREREKAARFALTKSRLTANVK